MFTNLIYVSVFSSLTWLCDWIVEPRFILQSLNNSWNYIVVCRRHEFRHNHGAWIDTEKPALDPLIPTHIPNGLEKTDTEVENCKMIQEEMCFAVNSLLKVLFFFTLVDASKKQLLFWVPPQE